MTNIIRGDSGGFLGTHPHHPRLYGVISFGTVTKGNIVSGLALLSNKYVWHKGTLGIEAYPQYSLPNCL